MIYVHCVPNLHRVPMGVDRYVRTVGVARHSYTVRFQVSIDLSMVLRYGRDRDWSGGPCARSTETQQGRSFVLSELEKGQTLSLSLSTM
jgi:hypothetical protein